MCQHLSGAGGVNENYSLHKESLGCINISLGAGGVNENYSPHKESLGCINISQELEVEGK